MLWTAATVLPLPGSDGEAVIDTLDTNFKYNAIVTPLAYLFAVSRCGSGGEGGRGWVGGGGGEAAINILQTNFKYTSFATRFAYLFALSRYDRGTRINVLV